MAIPPTTVAWADRRFLRGSNLRLLFGFWGAILACCLSVAADELRGLWVDAFHPGFHSAAEVRQLVADARRAHLNALFVEVRKRGDAYYESALVPRAIDIEPGFDPLGSLLKEAHDSRSGPRLQVHAWLVAYNIWNSQSTNPAPAEHAYRRHPDWLTQSHEGATWDGSNYALDPGHPQVQDHLTAVARELASRYDLDGLHWDYIRYAGREWGYNPVAVARFNRASGTTGPPPVDDPAWLQWRRDQVTALVRRTYFEAIAIRPRLQISAATITWTPSPTNDAQWVESAAFSRVLQDWRGWVEAGILDLVVPMAYFRAETNAVDWAHWSRFAKDHRGHGLLALGVGAYLNTPANVLRQIRSTRTPTASHPGADGVVLYSYASMAKGHPGSGEFMANLLTKPRAYGAEPPVFKTTAKPPLMPWKGKHREPALIATVIDSQTRQPIEGATIEVVGPGLKAPPSDANGVSGTFLPHPDDWTLRVSAGGYAGQSVPARVEADRVTRLEIALSPESQPENWSAQPRGREPAGGPEPAEPATPTRSPDTTASLSPARVPGVVVDHVPQRSGVYIGSPSLALLTDGLYVASHDEFGPGSTEHTRAVTRVFHSTDRGASWRSVARIDGAFWSNLLPHGTNLYLLGTDRHHGNVVIRRSTDGGVTWTEPTDAAHGLLRPDGQYHGAPVPVLIHAGRLWRGMERRDPPEGWGVHYQAGVLSAPLDADLLDATNWTFATFLSSNTNWNHGDFGAWLEGNVTLDPNGQVVDVLRVHTRVTPEQAAIVRVDADGRHLRFDPTRDFVPMPGGAKKFAIRWDPVSRQYWSLNSIVLGPARTKNPAGIRNSLALTASPDLRTWTVRCLLLHHPDATRHGFQYPDWQFDGDDLVALVRTAYDDDEAGAHNAHDANFLTFHRWAGFRKLTMPDSVPHAPAPIVPGP